MDRLSIFLLRQITGTDTVRPDFTKSDFENAIIHFPQCTDHHKLRQKLNQEHILHYAMVTQQRGSILW